MTYKTWLEARTAALTRMREMNVAQGIEYSKYDRTYTVKMLPPPGKRFGWELRCEAVEIGATL